MSAISNCFKCIPSNQLSNSIGKALTALQKKCAGLFAKIKSDNPKNAAVVASLETELEGRSLQVMSPGVTAKDRLSPALINGGYMLLTDDTN